MLLSTEKFPGPGPAIRQDPRFTRFGKVGTPVYTMRPFYPPLEADCVPGPPTYEWEKVHPYMEPHAPNYTMRRRTRYMLLPNNPAPNQYHLRTVIGRGQGCFPWEPGWTMLEDNKYYTFQKDLAKTPGPASVRVHPKVMDRVGHYVRAPCYTIGRRTGPVEKSRAPGPNVYGREFVTLHKPGIPELSFGERHSEFAGAMISRIDSKCLNLSQLLSRLPKPIWSGMRRSTACVTVVTAWTVHQASESCYRVKVHRVCDNCYGRKIDHFDSVNSLSSLWQLWQCVWKWFRRIFRIFSQMLLLM